MKKLILGAMLALGAPGAAQAAVVFSNDFEGGSNFVFTGNVQVANGATYAPCCGTPAGDTNTFVAFGGGNAPSGTISYTLATIVGQSYTLDFDYGALGGGSETFTAVGGGTSQSYNPVAIDDPISYTHASFSFIGTGSDVISFTSNGLDNVDSIVDNVVVSTVPEPASWAMMIGGFGLVGGAMRRRTRMTLRHA